MPVTDNFMIWWLRRSRYIWSKMHRQLFERRYLSTVLPTVSSLEDIGLCLKQVRWTADRPLHLYDYISYPQTVWATKKDDCDGFAVLAAELLRRWDPVTNPVIITAMVSPVELSHTVCAFRQGGNLMYFSNDELCSGNFQGYGDIIADLMKPDRRLVCWDVVKPDTLETLEFHVA
jgi:hypothetical protein